MDSCSFICVVGGCGFVVAAGLASMLHLCSGHGQQGSAPRSVVCVVRVIALELGYRAGVFGYKCCRVA